MYGARAARDKNPGLTAFFAKPLAQPSFVSNDVKLDAGLGWAALGAFCVLVKSNASEAEV